MSRELDLFSDAAARWEELGTVKLLSLELKGGLFLHDFEDDEGFFAYLEKKFGIDDFAEDRALAEQALIRLSTDRPRSFSLEAIYRGLCAAPEAEEKLLSDAFSLQPQVKRMLDIAVSRKIPVVATCDGPYPEVFWRSLLARHGISGINRIYASCDLGISKQKYTMFRQVLEDFAQPPGDVLHIGPDSYSDLDVPLDIGMKALQVIPPGEQLAASSALFSTVRDVAKATGEVEGRMMIKAMQDAVIGSRQSFASDEEAELATAGICLVGPILLGFCGWIFPWLRHHGCKQLILSAPEASIFVRVGSILLRRQFPDIDIMVVPQERVGDLGLALRDVMTEHAAIISVDPEGAGVGRLVARNPHLLLRPSLHFALSGSTRNSPRDQCFIHHNGLPLERARIGKSAEATTNLLFAGDPETTRVLLPAVGRFIIEWSKLESRYPGMRIRRPMVLRLLEVAGGLEEPVT